MDLNKIIGDMLQSPEIIEEFRNSAKEQLKREINGVVRSLFSYNSPLQTAMEKEINEQVKDMVFLPEFGNVIAELIQECRTDAFKQLILQNFQERIGLVADTRTPKTMKDFLQKAMSQIGEEDETINVKVDNSQSFVTIKIEARKQDFFFRFYNGRLSQFPLDFSIYRSFREDVISTQSVFETMCYKLYLGKIKLENDFGTSHEAEFDPEDYNDCDDDSMDGAIEEFLADF